MVSSLFTNLPVMASSTADISTNYLSQNTDFLYSLSTGVPFSSQNVSTYLKETGQTTVSSLLSSSTAVPSISTSVPDHRLVISLTVQDSTDITSQEFKDQVKQGKEEITVIY
jgi:hypothetical protein